MPNRPRKAGFGPDRDAAIKQYHTNLRAKIEKHGWAVQGVFPTADDDSRLSWLYTIGLTLRFEHPEIIVFGLPHQVGAPILNELGDRVKKGERIHAGRYNDVLAGVPVEFIPVDPKYLGTMYSYFNVARAVYGGPRFEAVQLVWPDKVGRFPWDEGFSLLELEPVLGARA